MKLKSTPDPLKSATNFKKPARIALGLLFILASTFHFSATEIELKLVPPFLPWRRTAVIITGILEFLGGIGVLIPRFQEAAGKGLALLLIAIFPANIYHTLKRKEFQGLTRTPIYHFLRWPLQMALIWWSLWSTKKVPRNLNRLFTQNFPGKAAQRRQVL